MQTLITISTSFRGKRGSLTVIALVFLSFAIWVLPNISHASLQDFNQPPSKIQERQSVPGEILVRFRTGATPVVSTSKPGMETALSVQQNEVQFSVRIERLAGPEIVKDLRLARVAPEETGRAIQALRMRPDVIYAEPNYIRHKFATPTDVRFTEQWALKNDGQGGKVDADIDADLAWDTTTGSSQIVVGVIDEGVDINHPDLQPNIWTNPGETAGNGIDDDGNGFVDDIHGWDFFHNDASVYDGTAGDTNTDSHGTHVAGIVGAAGNNGNGVAGVNWQVGLLPLKILGADNEWPATSSVLLTVRAYAYAKQMRDLYAATGGTRGANIRILNNSYGGYGESQAERDAIRALADLGILFVVAAGNESRNNDRNAVFPANYNESNVVSVSSTNRYDSPSGFSNYGSRTVHMAAPGDEILSTAPHSSYRFASGTSMASPHVAGVAALICAANPSITLGRLRAGLMLGGDQLSELSPTVFGTGGVITGRRLNAAGALATAVEADVTAPALPGAFQISSQQNRRLTLTWTATGDDGTSGLVSLYEIRYTDSDPGLSDPVNFQRGYTFVAPLPAASGTLQTATIDVPFRHTSGFIGIRALDNVGNASPIAAVPVSVNQDEADPYIPTVTAPEGLSTGGTPLGMIGDDLYSASPYQLPFDFPFFGTNGRGLYVSTNGVLYFSEPPRQNDFARTPDDAFSAASRLDGYRMIAALWDDLRTDHRAGGDIYVVKPDPTRIIFRWQAVTYDTPTGQNTSRGEFPVNFEVELRRDGTIIKRYGDGNTNLYPVVGISGGDPDSYLISSHTSEAAQISLSGAQTVVYTPRKPTPLPQPDMAIGLGATPEPVSAGQLLTYQLNAINRTFNVGAEQTRVTTQIPAGTSLVSVTANSNQGATVTAPPAGSTSGTITIEFGTIFFDTSGTATIVVQVNASPGSTITNTATIQSYWQDSNPSNNSATTNTLVVEAPPFNNIHSVSAGGMSGNADSHTVALKNDGTVWAWGGGLWGQLGDGTNSSSNSPVLTLNLTGVTAITAGGVHTLALKNDGTVWGWGSNQYGQLGFQFLQSTFYNVSPIQVPGVSSITAIAAGNTHNLALRSDGTVWAWGPNNYGQVGNGGTSGVPVYNAVQVLGLTNVKAIAAGPNYSLAVKTDGSLWGWGGNLSSVLGLPSSTFSSPTPVQIAGVSNVAAVTAGSLHVVALKTDGTLISWGNNSSGQLGDNNGPSSSTPRAVSGLNNVTAISAGFEHTLALRSDGTVWAWGRNLGNLGDGTTTNRTTPVQTTLRLTATGIAAGVQHSVALLSDGTAQTWGVNDSGQLGDRTRVNRTSPVNVMGALAVATPSFLPDGGSFQFPHGIMVICSTPGARIHYTQNGADPTQSDSSLSSGDTLFLNTTTILKARAYKSGWPASLVKTATFTFPTPSPTPTPSPVPGAADQPIAFVRQISSTGNNGADIFLINSDGSNSVNLTGVQGDDYSPAWSPDGSRLAFTCHRNPDGSIGGPRRVCVRNANGLGFSVLSQTSTEDFGPAWSRDGQRIAFTSMNQGFPTTVNIINADGTGRRPLNVDMLGASNPDWSADGQSIVVDYLNSIWVSLAYSYGYQRLTNSTGDSRPRYSANGAKIVFQSTRDGQPEIYVMNSDGSGQTRLTNNPAWDTAPAWSPDGTKILFTSLRDGPSALYLMNADGTNQTRLTDGSDGVWRGPSTSSLKLSQSSYMVNEGGGNASITITRTGDTSAAATVDYATSDTAGLNECNMMNNIGSSRCDYATSIGTLRFAAGESSKSIFVPVVDDGYTEGNENFTLTLSNATGLALGLPASATITIQDNDSSGGLNPLDDNDFFIRQQYIDFLGREPDPGGLAGWRNVLVNCGITIAPPCDRVEVSAGFFRSEEFQSRGYFIYRFFSAVGRIPVSEDFYPDFAKVSGFLTADQLEANKAAYVNEVMARPDFQTKYGSTLNNPTAYVEALLQTVGLPAHPSRQSWINTLNASNTTTTRGQVLRQLVESVEVYNKYYNEAFVIMQYFGYLRRTADASYLSWINTMNQSNGDYRTMINGFMNSSEYRRRFGP
ncbi:MAG TPA: S8 family serine peptidase [Pyrinomonadaceae bacterium]|nr:S8 family serine peptidase [Pyrinomonadaceae bacterium]